MPPWSRPPSNEFRIYVSPDGTEYMCLISSWVYRYVGYARRLRLLFLLLLLLGETRHRLPYRHLVIAFCYRRDIC